MTLQDQLNHSELMITLPQIKAFFLGSMIGKKPLTTDKAISELFADIQVDEKLSTELTQLWNELKKNELKEMKNLFIHDSKFSTALEFSKEQLDFFLTGLGLAGTSAESDQDSLLGEVLDELEDLVLDMDDYLASNEQTDEETAAIEEDLQTLWRELLKTRQ